MKAALLYGSSHGRTKKVVTAALDRLDFVPDAFNVRNGVDQGLLAGYELLLFFSPTYGDQELQNDMEDFIAALDVDLAGKLFAICELGNYYGYDDFSFGAMKIIRRRLIELNATELCDPLSLDSFPKVAWGHFESWIEYLNGKLKQHV